MTRMLRSALISLALCLPVAAWAQVPVEAAKDQAKLLTSPDPKLAANKRLVYDFWREILEGGHLELIDKYMAESYIQHNPAVGTGRAAFVELFTKLLKPKPISATIQGPLVSLVAEGDRVIISFVQEVPDPKNPGKTYTTTWFDMFRIENGKLAEHWDPSPKG